MLGAAIQNHHAYERECCCNVKDKFICHVSLTYLLDSVLDGAIRFAKCPHKVEEQIDPEKPLQELDPAFIRCCMRC